jgi:O-antigen ligase
MTRANDIIGWFVLAVAVLSPIPFGSNPPIYWAISGTLVGLFAAWYLLRAQLAASPFRVPLRIFAPLIGLWSLLCLWLVAQALPLGQMFGGFEFANPLGAPIVSNTLSLAPGSTWLMLIRTVSYGLLFFLAAQAGANHSRAHKLLTLLFWALVAHAAFGLLQLTQLGDTILGFDKKYYPGVATGTFVNRNSYATFLAMGLTLGTALFSRFVLSSRQRHERLSEIALRLVLVIAGLFVITVALLATQSRMGLFAGMLGVLVVAVMILRWLPHAEISVPATLLGSGLIGAVIIWIFGQGVLERAIDLAGASGGRGVLYEQVLTMIRARPILGYGGGAFELGFPLFFGPPLSLDLLYDKAHSTYLTLAAELGVVAALLPVAILSLVFARLATRALARSDRQMAPLAGVGVIVVAAVHSTVDFSLEIQANAYFLTAVIGLAFGAVCGGGQRGDRPEDR